MLDQVRTKLMIHLEKKKKNGRLLEYEKKDQVTMSKHPQECMECNKK